MSAHAMRSQGTRRSAMMRRNEGVSAVLWLWLRRLGAFCLLIALLGLGGLWFVAADSAEAIQKRIIGEVLAWTGGLGYKVENILVEGRVNVETGLVLKVVGVEKGDPLFKVDPDAIKAELDRIPWIKSARIERRLPGTVYVRIQERVPFALWKSQDGLVLIDREGVVLTARNLDRFKDLILVKGQGAPIKAAELSEILKAEPLVMRRLDFAVLVENRRWDLHLKDHKIVKLPEKDVGLALRTLMMRQEQEGVFDKPLTILDLRDPQRLVVEAELGKALEFTTDSGDAGQNL